MLNRNFYLTTVALVGAPFLATAALAQSADNVADDLNAQQLALLTSGESGAASAASDAGLAVDGGVDTMEMNLSSETDATVDSDVEATGEGDREYDAAEDTVLEDAAEATDDAVNDAGEAIDDAADATGEAIEDTVEDAGDAADDAVDAAGEAIDDAADAKEDAADDVADEIEN